MPAATMVCSPTVRPALLPPAVRVACPGPRSFGNRPIGRRQPADDDQLLAGLRHGPGLALPTPPDVPYLWLRGCLLLQPSDALAQVRALLHFRCTIWVLLSRTFPWAHAAASTRWRSRSKQARPYIWRLISLSCVIRPSTGPVLHGSVSAASTAAASRSSARAKPPSSLPRAAASHGRNAAWSRVLIMAQNRRARRTACSISGVAETSKADQVALGLPG